MHLSFESKIKDYDFRGSSYILVKTPKFFSGKILVLSFINKYWLCLIATAT